MFNKKIIYQFTSLLLFIMVLKFDIFNLLTNSRLLITILLYLAVLAFCYFQKIKAKAIGFSIKHIKSSLYFISPILVVMILAAAAVSTVSPDLFLDQRHNKAPIEIFFYILFIIPLSSVLIEEVIFRGVIPFVLSKKSSIKSSYVVSSLMFGLWHVVTAGSVSLNFARNQLIPEAVMVSSTIVLFTFLVGLFFSWLRVRTKSLFAPIFVHWFSNGLGVLLAYLASR